MSNSSAVNVTLTDALQNLSIGEPLSSFAAPFIPNSLSGGPVDVLESKGVPPSSGESDSATTFPSSTPAAEVFLNNPSFDFVPGPTPFDNASEPGHGATPTSGFGFVSKPVLTASAGDKADKGTNQQQNEKDDDDDDDGAASEDGSSSSSDEDSSPIDYVTTEDLSNGLALNLAYEYEDWDGYECGFDSQYGYLSDETEDEWEAYVTTPKKKSSKSKKKKAEEKKKAEKKKTSQKKSLPFVNGFSNTNVRDFLVRRALFVREETAHGITFSKVPKAEQIVSYLKADRDPRKETGFRRFKESQNKKKKGKKIESGLERIMDKLLFTELTRAMAGLPPAFPRTGKEYKGKHLDSDREIAGALLGELVQKNENNLGWWLYMIESLEVETAPASAYGSGTAAILSTLVTGVLQNSKFSENAALVVPTLRMLRAVVDLPTLPKLSNSGSMPENLEESVVTRALSELPVAFVDLLLKYAPSLSNDDLAEEEKNTVTKQGRGNRRKSSKGRDASVKKPMHVGNDLGRRNPEVGRLVPKILCKLLTRVGSRANIVTDSFLHRVAEVVLSTHDASLFAAYVEHAVVDTQRAVYALVHCQPIKELHGLVDYMVSGASLQSMLTLRGLLHHDDLLRLFEGSQWETSMLKSLLFEGGPAKGVSPTALVSAVQAGMIVSHLTSYNVLTTKSVSKGFLEVLTGETESNSAKITPLQVVGLLRAAISHGADVASAFSPSLIGAVCTAFGRSTGKKDVEMLDCCAVLVDKLLGVSPDVTSALVRECQVGDAISFGMGIYVQAQAPRLQINLKALHDALRRITKRAELDTRLFLGRENVLQKVLDLTKSFDVRGQPLARLPIDSKAVAIVRDVEAQPVTVIEGETGSGKSSRVPRFLLNFEQYARKNLREENGSRRRHPLIYVTQPRRIAATSLAKRVANELGEEPGATVGYCIGQARKVSYNSRIVFVTSGWLLAKLVHQPSFLDKVTHLVLDEIHERSVDSDLLYVVLKRLLNGVGSGDTPEERRDVDAPPTTKLILMSATFNTDMFSRYFRSHRPPRSIFCGAHRHPVEIRHLEELASDPCFSWTFHPFDEQRAHLEGQLRSLQTFGMSQNAGELHAAQLQLQAALDVLEKRRLLLTPPVAAEQLTFSAAKVRKSFPTYHINDLDFQKMVASWAVRVLAFNHRDEIANPDGTCVLVFCPGLLMIEEIARDLEERMEGGGGELEGRLDIHMLHSIMDHETQSRVFSPIPAGHTRIVLSTNITESSVTIDSVRYVIDTGLSKKLCYDARSRMDRLSTSFISQASAKQRAGRAGRLMPGTVFRLYPKMDLVPYDDPEIVSVSLANTVLRLKSTGGTAKGNPLSDPKAVLSEALQAPSKSSVQDAYSELLHSHALERWSEEEAKLRHQEAEDEKESDVEKRGSNFMQSELDKTLNIPGPEQEFPLLPPPREPRDNKEMDGRAEVQSEGDEEAEMAIAVHLDEEALGINLGDDTVDALSDDEPVDRLGYPLPAPLGDTMSANDVGETQELDGLGDLSEPKVDNDTAGSPAKEGKAVKQNQTANASDLITAASGDASVEYPLERPPDNMVLTAFGRFAAGLPLALETSTALWTAVLLKDPCVLVQTLINAAVVSSKDVFLLPHPLVMKDRAAYIHQVSRVTNARIRYDEGRHSDLFAASTAVVDFIVERNRRPESTMRNWCSAKGLHHTRCCTVINLMRDLASRVAKLDRLLPSNIISMLRTLAVVASPPTKSRNSAAASKVLQMIELRDYRSYVLCVLVQTIAYGPRGLLSAKPREPNPKFMSYAPNANRAQAVTAQVPHRFLSATQPMHSPLMKLRALEPITRRVLNVHLGSMVNSTSQAFGMEFSHSGSKEPSIPSIALTALKSSGLGGPVVKKLRGCVEPPNPHAVTLCRLFPKRTKDAIMIPVPRDELWASELPESMALTACKMPCTDLQWREERLSCKVSLNLNSPLQFVQARPHDLQHWTDNKVRADDGSAGWENNSLDSDDEPSQDVYAIAAALIEYGRLVSADHTTMLPTAGGGRVAAVLMRMALGVFNPAWIEKPLRELCDKWRSEYLVGFKRGVRRETGLCESAWQIVCKSLGLSAKAASTLVSTAEEVVDISPPGDFSVGQDCMAKYSADGGWYHAMIIEELVNGYIVSYTQYDGQQEVVGLGDVRRVNPGEEVLAFVGEEKSEEKTAGGQLPVRKKSKKKNKPKKPKEKKKSTAPQQQQQQQQQQQHTPEGPIPAIADGEEQQRKVKVKSKKSRNKKKSKGFPKGALDETGSEAQTLKTKPKAGKGRPKSKGNNQKGPKKNGKAKGGRTNSTSAAAGDLSTPAPPTSSPSPAPPAPSQ